MACGVIRRCRSLSDLQLSLESNWFKVYGSKMNNERGGRRRLLSLQEQDQGLSVSLDEFFQDGQAILLLRLRVRILKSL